MSGRGVVYVSTGLSVCQYGLLGPATAFLLGLILVVSRPVCIKHPNLMAGPPADPDKPVCFMSCRELKLTQKCTAFFVDFCSRPPVPTFSAKLKII